MVTIRTKEAKAKTRGKKHKVKLKTVIEKYGEKYSDWFDALEYYYKYGKLPADKVKYTIIISHEAKRKLEKFCREKGTNPSKEIERIVRELVK